MKPIRTAMACGPSVLAIASGVEGGAAPATDGSVATIVVVISAAAALETAVAAATVCTGGGVTPAFAVADTGGAPDTVLVVLSDVGDTTTV